MDPTQYTTSDQMRASMIGFESLLEDEENQVRGFTYVFDERDVGLALITLWSPSEVTKVFHLCEVSSALCSWINAVIGKMHIRVWLYCLQLEVRMTEYVIILKYDIFSYVILIRDVFFINIALL